MPISEEQRMWRAVILQALEDLFAKDSREQRDAVRWIFKNNKDFAMVCEFAEISPRHVRQCAFGKIINGTDCPKFYMTSGRRMK